MTLLITIVAAIVSTILWYTRENKKLASLCLMYWGASAMWFIDAVVEYIELGADYFTPAAADMLNDAYLGFSVVVLGLFIWTIMLLIKDPDNKIKALIKK